MQHRLRIAARLLSAFQHKFERCLEFDGIIEIAGHVAVGRIAFMQLVADHLPKSPPGDVSLKTRSGLWA